MWERRELTLMVLSYQRSGSRTVRMNLASGYAARSSPGADRSTKFTALFTSINNEELTRENASREVHCSGVALRR